MNPFAVHRLHGPLDPYKWYNLIGAIGCVFWIIAYVLVILQARRQKTYGIPMFAICLNFSWEVLQSLVLDREHHVKTVGLWLLFDRAWLFVDAAIVWQLLRYGRSKQSAPEVQRFFHPIVVALMVIAFAGQFAFAKTYFDPYGIIDAYAINLVMSVLFIVRYLEDRDTGDLAYGVAGAKAMGSALTSIECYFLLPKIHPAMSNHMFLRYLHLAVFFFDLVYVGLLWQARRAAASYPSPASSSSA